MKVVKIEDLNTKITEENKKKSNKNKGKKRTVKAFDGESFKLSINKEKKIRQTKQMVSKLKLNLGSKIKPNKQGVNVWAAMLEA